MGTCLSGIALYSSKLMIGLCNDQKINVMPQAKMNYFGTCITNTTEEKSVKTIHLSGFDTLLCIINLKYSMLIQIHILKISLKNI